VTVAETECPTRALRRPFSDAATADLLLQARIGDEAAWEELVRRYRGVIMSVVRSFRLQPADAADVVQATWLRFAESGHRLRDADCLGSWLRTTAIRECLRMRRQARQVSFDELDHVIESCAGPEDRAIDQATARTVRSLVAELPPRRRQLLELILEDDRTSYAEVASRIGMPIGSIGPTRARSFDHLRARLEAAGLAPTA
jgi:RNA polymerase sigma factor (sigma-70 family)